MIVLTNGKSLPWRIRSFTEWYSYVKNLLYGNKASDEDIQVCAELVVDLDAIKSDKKASSMKNWPPYLVAIKNINNDILNIKLSDILYLRKGPN